MTDTKTSPPEEPKTHFTREVILHKRSANGALELDKDGKKTPVRVLGPFTFKVENMRTKVEIGVRRARLTGGLRPDSIDADTYFAAELLSTLPMVVTDAPHGWPKTREEWENRIDQYLVTEEDALQAIYAEYRLGVQQFQLDGQQGSPPEARVP